MFNLKKLLCIASVCLIAVPIPALAYHTPTQAPYGVNASDDSTAGTFTIGILGSDGAEDSPPENYTIFFSLSSGITETNSFCVTTSFGHQTNTWQYYTFTLDDLKYYFNNPAGQNIYYRVRANNETDNIVSTLTNENSWSLYAGSPYDYNQENWSAPSGNNACNPYVVTTTTTTTTSSTTTTTVPDTTTTSSTTTSSTTSSTTTSTTTTTTTTTLPPPPPTTTTTLAPVIVKIGGEEVEYTQSEVDDGTVDRDIERQANEDEWGCYVTNVALERGDCPAYNDFLKQEEEKEEVIIEIKDEEITDTETELPDDDVVVLEVESDDEIKDIEDEVIEEIKIDVKELEEEFKFEEEEIVIEIPEEIIIIIEEDVEDELDKEILTDDTESKTEIQKEDELIIEEEVIEEQVELTEEEIQEEVKEVEEKIEAIQETNVEELETVQVVEIIEEVNDAGLENLTEVSEDVLEVVSQVVEQSIAKADELTEEQQEVVAEVLGFTETEDVQVIAEAVKTDKTVAKAVEEYVERVVKNADIEDYNLADVTTEITFESLAQGDFSVIIDVDLDAINLANITDDMSSQQKEKAQEVIVPTIMVRILSLAVRRFN